MATHSSVLAWRIPGVGVQPQQDLGELSGWTASARDNTGLIMDWDLVVWGQK